MAPDFERWREVLPNQLAAERDIIQAQVISGRSRSSALNWSRLLSLMKRFKANKYDAFLGKLRKVVKISEQEYIRDNSIKGPVRTAIV